MLADALGSRIEAQQQERQAAAAGKKERRQSWQRSLAKSLLSPQSRAFLKNILTDD